MVTDKMPNLADMGKIVSLCQRRGFIFQSSEIYGGLSSCWDYGPLGVELKRNVKEAWWRANVQQRDDVVGIDSSILMHPGVWAASGHIAGFSDPLIECKNCNQRFRADHIWVDVSQYEATREGAPIFVSTITSTREEALIKVAALAC